MEKAYPRRIVERYTADTSLGLPYYRYNPDNKTPFDDPDEELSVNFAGEEYFIHETNNFWLRLYETLQLRAEGVFDKNNPHRAGILLDRPYHRLVPCLNSLSEGLPDFMTQLIYTVNSRYVRTLSQNEARAEFKDDSKRREQILKELEITDEEVAREKIIFSTTWNWVMDNSKYKSSPHLLYAFCK